MGKHLVYLTLLLAFGCSSRNWIPGNKPETSRNPLYTSNVDVTVCTEENYKDHVQEINSKLRTSKTQIRELNDLGNCLSMAKQYSLSMYYYELALSMPKINHEQKSLIYSNVANIYLMTGNSELAFKNLEQAVKFNLGSTALTKIGILSFQRGDFAKSRSYLAQAIKYNPENLAILDYYGTVSFILKDLAAIDGKVLVRINDKSSERFQIFDSARRLLIKPTQEEALDVSSLAVNSPALITLQKYIVENYYEKNDLPSSSTPRRKRENSPR